MLEPEKQQFLIHHLAQSAADFETAIASADPAHWTTRPAPDAWSIAEIAEHVLMIDGIVVQLCAKFEEWPEEHYDLEHTPPRRCLNCGKQLRDHEYHRC